jgi:hypothetical protein
MTEETLDKKFRRLQCHADTFANQRVTFTGRVADAKYAGRLPQSNARP